MANKKNKIINEQKNKRKKFKWTKNLTKALAITLAGVFIGISSLFVVDSFAVANPKCYHKFLSSTFNGSYDTDTSPNKYWQVDMIRNSSSNEQTMTYLIFKYSPINSQRLGKLIVNLSDLKSRELDVFVGYSAGRDKSPTEVKSFTLTRKDVKSSKDGWFEFYNSEIEENQFKYGENYIFLGLKGDVRIREIFALNLENSISNLSDSNIIDVCIKVDEGFINYRKWEENENSAKNVFNEQESQKSIISGKYE